MFCYDLTRVARVNSEGGFSTSRINANKKYETHYRNSLILRAVAMRPDIYTFAQRRRAEEELKVCERKIAYWERQANFDYQLARAFVERANKWHITLD